MKKLDYDSLIVSIKGITDGKYPVEVNAIAERIQDIFPEFRGELQATGTLRKYGKRYLFDLTATATAHLLCDMSGEDFEEQITAHCSLEYIADTHLALMQEDSSNDREPPFYIRDDNTSIDITEEIRQELAVMLPLKRISPAYRDKEFDEVFPEFAAQTTDEISSAADDEPALDPRWAALKSIKFDG